MRRALPATLFRLSVGEVSAALTTAQQAIVHADQGGGEGQMSIKRAVYAAALHVAGRRAEAEQQFGDAERRQKERRPQYPLLYSLQGYWYCDLLISKGDYVAARDRDDYYRTAKQMDSPDRPGHADHRARAPRAGAGGVDGRTLN
jgi:hypothetical protein